MAHHLVTYKRVCAAALLLVGALFVVGAILNISSYTDAEAPLSEEAASPWWVPSMAPFLAMVALTILALPGIYLVAGERTGAGGLALFVVATFGLLAAVGTLWIMTFVPPVLATEAPALLDADEPPGILSVGIFAGWIGLTLAFLAIGILVAWDGTLPRWAGALVGAGGLLGFLPEPFHLAADPLMAVGMTWLGLALWRHTRGDTVDASPVEPAAVTALVGHR